MTAADRAKKLKLKEKSSGLGAPPALDEIKGNLGGALMRGRPGRKRKAEEMTQLNLRVPEELKYRLRILATRDRREMSDIVIEAITLYEARYGAAPSLEPTREG
jgi:predicted DNA-binding protein